MSWSKDMPVATPPPGPLLRDHRRGQFDRLLEFSPDAIFIVDADGLLSEWNPAAAPMLQSTSAPPVNAPLRELLSTPHRESFNTAWKQLLAGQAVPRVTVPLGPDAESESTLEVTVAPIRFGTELAGAVVLLRDPTARSLKERGAREQQATRPGDRSEPTAATTQPDGPAGLPGRWWLQKSLSKPPAAGSERGVAVIDIDAFALVIATYGLDAADEVLTEFAQRLRSLDTPGAFAHWRADSFVWIVDTEDPVTALDKCVATLNDALKEPFLVGPDRVWLTLSIGLATTTVVVGGDLLAAAGDAAQTAKRLGGSKTVAYDESMQASSSSGFRLANDLHHAITHDELRLHYQPIMDVSTNEISGVEALVRWERPGVGLLAPAAFIDIAERTGQIVPLGNWVVRTACHNAPGLGSSSGGPRTMSINVSARQLLDPGLIETLREAMAEGQCAPSTIVIEVTESVLLHDLHTVADSLDAIKALDVGLDLDDFGTGYSSLQYLRDLPIDRLKVDQGFVAGLGINGADTAIVASTIALAHALDLKAIAEGVETDEQLALLREMGCDFAQGYLWNRPADMETFIAWLDAYVPALVPPTPAATLVELTRERHDAAELRDAKADTRATAANARDTVADTRDTTANARDDTADERERVADLRDETATDREHAEDDREGERRGSGNPPPGGRSSSTRRNAKQARSRATAGRRIDASDRTKANKSRDDASAGRANVARARAKQQSDPVSEDDGGQ